MTYTCLHCYAEIEPAQIVNHLSTCGVLECRKNVDDLEFLIEDMVVSPN